jgi:four helix bundle protein
MNTSNRHANPPPPAKAAGLKGLHAYQNALAFYQRCLVLTRALAPSHLTRQLTKAAESTALNIAEAYPTFGADRARRFRIAADEASECGAALDLLELRGEVGGLQLQELRSLLDRERAMLWRLSRPR